jgi:hypothetical protein
LSISLWHEKVCCLRLRILLKEPDARIRIDKMLIEAGWKLPGWSKDEEINVKTEINNASGEADYVLIKFKRKSSMYS